MIISIVLLVLYLTHIVLLPFWFWQNQILEKLGNIPKVTSFAKYEELT